MFTEKATEAVLRASHKDEKHTPRTADKKESSIEHNEPNQENSICHKDQKSDTPLDRQESIDDGVVNQPDDSSER